LIACGQIVDTIIQNIPPHLHVTIDAYVIMPNHVHLIAVITEENVLREIYENPLQSRTIMSKLIGYIKMNSSKMIRRHYGDIAVWQRGYHDHVIRNKEDYVALLGYIQTNPIRWELDKLYTEE
jgi:REP element-mobilizing transposase RayT